MILAVLLGAALYGLQQVRATSAERSARTLSNSPPPPSSAPGAGPMSEPPPPAYAPDPDQDPGDAGPADTGDENPSGDTAATDDPTGPRLTGALTGYGPDDDAVHIEEHPVATPTEADRTLLTVIARMTALPGKEQELRSTLEGLVEPTLAEDGNVNYDLHVAKDDPATFFFYENWTGSAKFDAHLASDHLVAFANRLGELLVDGADGLVITHLQRIK